MTWGAVAVAGVGLVGSVMSSNAAGKASDQQAQASAQANALQQYMFDQNVALQMPTINTGNAARDRLSYLLGLSPTGYSGTGAGGAQQLQTYDQLRSQLLSQYTKNGVSGASNPGGLNLPPPTSQLDAYNQMTQYVGAGLGQPSGGVGSTGIPYKDGEGPGYWEPATTGTGADEAGRSQRWVSMANQATSSVDESGLDAEIKRRLADQDAQRQAQIDAAKNDPDYGRLAQQFQFDTYTPDVYTPAEKFSYTGEDLYKDPSYQFRLDQGQKALDRQGAASGRFLSGAQLQASSDYNQGAASQEFQNAYQRALGTFGTNETNRYNAFATNSTNKYNAFNTNQNNRFNAYQSNFNNAVNPLLSLAGSATLGSQFLGGAGQQTAQLMGNNLTSNANAQGAAGIASANQISGGLSNAVNGYQQNQLMNSLLNRGSVNNNPSGGRTDTLFGSSGFYSGNGGSGD